MGFISHILIRLQVKCKLKYLAMNQGIRRFSNNLIEIETNRKSGEKKCHPRAVYLFAAGRPFSDRSGKWNANAVSLHYSQPQFMHIIE